MRALLLSSALILSACTGLEQKAENYRNAASMAANPEKIRIVYEREGGTATFYETRCTGRLCDQ